VERLENFVRLSRYAPKLLHLTDKLKPEADATGRLIRTRQATHLDTYEFWQYRLELKVSRITIISLGPRAVP